MQQIINDDPLLTFNEALAYLRVSRSTLLRWLNDGTVPGYKVGNGWRFRKGELQQVIKPANIKK